MIELYCIYEKKLTIYKTNENTKIYQDGKKVNYPCELNLNWEIYIKNEKMVIIGKIGENLFWTYKEAKTKLNIIIAKKIQILSKMVISNRICN